MPNKALHRTAIPLRFLAAGELERFTDSFHRSSIKEQHPELSLTAMALHCGVCKDITLLGFPISESLEHTFLACIRLPDIRQIVVMCLRNL